MQDLMTRQRLTTHRLWTAVLLALLVAGIVFVPGAAAQGTDTPRLTVITEALNVRGGPAVSYPVIGLLRQGDEVTVIGQHASSGWWQVKLPDGRSGWVSGALAYVRLSGDTADLPEVAPPALPATPATVVNNGLTGTIVF